MKTNRQSADEKIIQLEPRPRRKSELAAVSRFKIIQFTNRNGTESHRVTGYKRDGGRIRENFLNADAAKCRQVELETEWLARKTDTQIRATKLTAEELKLAEVAFLKLGDDWMEILSAVDYWKEHGRKLAVKDSVKLDEAVEQFKTWLENLKPGAEGYMRDLSKQNLRLRVSIFANAVPNARLDTITTDFVADYLGKRDVSAKTRDNDRRALSRFFGWCIERPRRWLATNPARKEGRSRKSGENAQPAILTLDECRALLAAATTHADGAVVPYVAVCLFAGLRPFEAQRLNWAQVNLGDKEIRLEASQTKTKTSRVVKICPTLAAWLKKYKDKPFYPANWRRDFDAVKLAAGFSGREQVGDAPKDSASKLKPYVVDVMRHTAISHFFRDSGSYGFTAEQFGNSESVIKKHYQGRVSTTDTKRFYTLTPKAVK